MFSVPDIAKVTAYNTLERNGFIYIWHHAESNEPDWEPPEIPEITNGQWVYRGRTEHIVNAHIEVRAKYIVLALLVTGKESIQWERFFELVPSKVTREHRYQSFEKMKGTVGQKLLGQEL